MISTNIDSRSCADVNPTSDNAVVVTADINSGFSVLDGIPPLFWGVQRPHSREVGEVLELAIIDKAIDAILQPR